MMKHSILNAHNIILQINPGSRIAISSTGWADLPQKFEVCLFTSGSLTAGITSPWSSKSFVRGCTNISNMMETKMTYERLTPSMQARDMDGSGGKTIPRKGEGQF
jgi:hypothetical protein